MYLYSLLHENCLILPGIEIFVVIILNFEFIETSAACSSEFTAQCIGHSHYATGKL